MNHISESAGHKERDNKERDNKERDMRRWTTVRSKDVGQFLAV